jgi:hypothetical protein
MSENLSLSGLDRFDPFSPILDPDGQRHLVFWGIGISVYIDANPGQGWVDIHSAGIDFV